MIYEVAVLRQSWDLVPHPNVVKDVVVEVCLQIGDQSLRTCTDQEEMEHLQLLSHVADCFVFVFGHGDVDETSFRALSSDKHDTQLKSLELGYHASKFIVIYLFNFCK